MQPEWISAQEAADILRVSRPRVHQLVRANVLDGAHVGGRLLVHRRSVEIRGRSKYRRQSPMFSRPTLAALRERRDVIKYLVELHGGRNLRVFGSAARGDSRIDSDIDFFIELDPGRGALDVAGLATDLEEELARRVDLIVDDGTPAAAEIATKSVPFD